MQTRFFRARKESRALQSAYRSSEIASGRFAVSAARIGRYRWRGAGSDEFRPPIFVGRQRRSSAVGESWRTPGFESCFGAFTRAAGRLQMGNALDERFASLRRSGSRCNRNSGAMDLASRVDGGTTAGAQGVTAGKPSFLRNQFAGSTFTSHNFRR